MVYFDKNYKMTYKIPKYDPYASLRRKEKKLQAMKDQQTDPSTLPMTYDSTLINRDDSEENESSSSQQNWNKYKNSSEKFTIQDLSNRNNNLNSMFSKISPKRYYRESARAVKFKNVLNDSNDSYKRRNSHSMASLNGEIRSSQTIASIMSIKSSRLSADDREKKDSSLQSLYAPHFKKRETPAQILEKWKNNKVAPFDFSMNLVDMLSGDLKKLNRMNDHYGVFHIYLSSRTCMAKEEQHAFLKYLNHRNNSRNRKQVRNLLRKHLGFQNSKVLGIWTRT